MGFNFLTATFDRAGFKKFCRQVIKTNDSTQEVMNRSVKSILIPTPCKGLNLLLSVSELEVLYKILEEADNEMKAQELIKEFATS
jgi:hypothetical protein